MEQQHAYHVLLEGRKVGPYDRRTILGMRIKKALTSEHVLIGGDGTQTTVGELIRAEGVAPRFQPERSSASVIQAVYPAALSMVRGRGFDIPAFRGQVEVRVQGDVLRIAGRFRKGIGWKDGRVKLPISAIQHVRVGGSQFDAWLRGAPGEPLQRITLEMFNADTASALRDWLPSATPLPPGHPSQVGAIRLGSHAGMWVAAAAVSAVIVGLLLVLVLARRF